MNSSANHFSPTTMVPDTADDFTSILLPCEQFTGHVFLEIVSILRLLDPVLHSISKSYFVTTEKLVLQDS